MMLYFSIRRAVLAAAAFLALPVPICPAQPGPQPSPPVTFERTPESLLQNGSSAAALESYKGALAKAEQSGDKPALWTALMSIAWYEHETGRNREAIEYSNRALAVASELNDPFMIGRSLDWLGWSYSGLGMYQLAEQFYQNGVEVGAPHGKIVHVAVWGLAAQELGALHFKMGKVEQAKKEIEATTNFARKNHVSAGVAEGAAHLAEIALVQGRISEAESLAHEAVDAAVECACSPYNTARARTVLAKAVWERAKGDPAKEEAARLLIAETAAKNQATGVTTMAAEAKLLAAKAIPADKFQERYDLVREAFESLEALDSDRRGSAEAQLGGVLMENDQTELAETYIKHGYKVNREMFRKIDNAYILGDLASIRGLKNDRQKMYKDLQTSADRAEKMKALPLALETQTKIAEELLADGYDTLALEWNEKALENARKLIEAEKNSAVKQRYQAAEAALMEKIVSLQVTLRPGGKADPASPLDRQPAAESE